MIPLVEARCFGRGPSGLPKTRTWSRSKSQSLPLACAYSTACWSLRASMPTSAGAFFSHLPGGGKYGAVVCATARDETAANNNGAANKKRRLNIFDEFIQLGEGITSHLARDCARSSRPR